MTNTMQRALDHLRDYTVCMLWIFGIAIAAGPDWRWVAGIGGVAVSLVGGFAVNQHVSQVHASFTEVKAHNGVQDVRIGTQGEELATLKVRLERLPIIENKIDMLARAIDAKKDQ